MNKISAYSIPGIVVYGKASTAKKIIKEVCSYFCIEEKILIGRSRKMEYVLARQIATYLIRNETKAKLTDIGKELGQDHTTVVHSIKKINDFISIKDDVVIESLINIKMKLKMVS